MKHFYGGPGKLSQYTEWPRAGRSGDQTTVVARISTPVQTDPGAHTASHTMGTGAFPGHGIDHPPRHLAPRLKKE